MTTRGDDLGRRQVTKVRLVLDLEVVRGRRWRELAPFREAVLFHFTPPALRDKVIAMSEAVADRILEEVTAESGQGEPEVLAHLRAVIADLRHGENSLREVAATYADEIEAAEKRDLLRLALQLARSVERGLAKIESRIGTAPG